MGMKVYDTHVDGSKGRLHFDVCIPEDKGDDFAVESGQKYLDSIDEGSSKMTTNECIYCHIQNPTPDQDEAIKKDGYFIIKMDGCPE